MTSIRDALGYSPRTTAQAHWLRVVEDALARCDAITIREACATLAASLPLTDIQRSGRPYLRRYTLDDLGPGRERIYLHHFVAGDSPAYSHSHPWDLSRSVILAGGYREHRPGETPHDRLPGMCVEIRSSTFHRIELLEADCWTVFNTGLPAGGGAWCFLELRSGRRIHPRAMEARGRK